MRPLKPFSFTLSLGLVLLFLWSPLARGQMDYIEPIQISPRQLVEAYQTDFHRADAMYTGKLVIVTGRVRTIRPPQRVWNFHQDKLYAYISMEAGNYQPLLVYFWEWEAEKMNRAQVGATISVMGFCQGVPPQLSLVGACIYPSGCGGPVQDFWGPHYKVPPSQRRSRPAQP